MSVRALLVRGLVAGLVAGLSAGVFAFAVGEPRMDVAIALEQQRPHAGGEPAKHAEPLVTREAQKGFLFVATGLWGMAMGGLYALVFAMVRRRSGTMADSSLALALCLALFVAVALVPALKYPANPPGAGDPETVARRTELYFVLVGLSLVSLIAAWRAAQRVRQERPAWMRWGIGAGVFVATVAVVAAVLPGFGEVPADVPDGLLWEFRLASLGTQLTLWATLGGVFAVLVRNIVRHFDI